MYQSPYSQAQRLKEIQKSNLHVKNLIDSAKKMIYNPNNMSATEKQILQVKISIQKDHLKNTFYKIDCLDNGLNLSIINKNQKQVFSPFSKPSTYNETKNTIKLQTTQSYDQTNKNSFEQTKIVISRIVQKDQASDQINKQNNSSLLRQSQFSETYKSKNQTARTYTIESPERNTKIVIKTKQQPYQSNDRFNMTQEIYRPQNRNVFQVKSPSSSPRTQRFQIKEYSNVEPYYEEQISLFTPQRTYRVKNTQTIQDTNNGSYQVSSGRNTKDIHRNERYYGNSQKYSQKSTSYKEILQKNKQKLQDSRQKNIKTASKSPSYKLNLQKLFDKKQQGKKRLYGQSYLSTFRQPSIPSGVKLKYSIANSQRCKIQDATSKKSGNTTNRQKSQTQRSKQQSLSQQKSKTLHTTTIKGIHLPCSSPCPKCKSKIKKPKQKQQPLSQYHLAKKYLTPQGEQECYNFLRSQGIEEKDWPIFITQYVYRQLSKTYNQISSHKAQQTN